MLIVIYVIYYLCEKVYIPIEKGYEDNFGSGR